MAEKMSNIDRAKQFLPFNSLRGFYELVKNKEKIVEKKRDLSSDELEILSFKFDQLVVGKIVLIKYYDIDGYISFQGIITKIDLINKIITLVDTKIKLVDIVEIEAEWLKDYSF